MSTAAVHVIAGFSKTNRWLLYTSMMLSPAQYLSGQGSRLPVNLGFLAYNAYTQFQWFHAVRSKEIHALSLVPVHLNMTLTLCYLGGISCKNKCVAVLLTVGTAGVIVLNCVSAWLSWSTCQREGSHLWQFFLLGRRTFSPGWHKFMLLWGIFDSISALCVIITSTSLALCAAAEDALCAAAEKPSRKASPYWDRWLLVVVGSVIMLSLFGAPLITWIELIVHYNHIESDTDWIAVWMFIAQVGMMVLPNSAFYRKCFLFTRESVDDTAQDLQTSTSSGV